MRLNELLTPKSPRIVPGSAFEPNVAPIISFSGEVIASLPASREHEHRGGWS